MTDLLPSCNSLYRRALAESFEALPPVLRRFHDAPGNAKADGYLCIARGPGRLRNALASLMRLPPSGERTPVHLEVRVEGEMERWTRDFGSLRLVTRQRYANGLLIESAGPLHFGFRVSATPSEMRFAFVRCRLYGCPLPGALAPRVHAVVRGLPASWWVEVRVEAPALGLLVRYEGEMTPEC